MATLTKADAARQLGISRTTLYKLINGGKLSPTPDGLIDTAELVRVLSIMNVQRERPRTPLDTMHLDAKIQGYEHTERPGLTSSEHKEWTSTERQLTSSVNTSEHQVTSTYRDLVDILCEQLHAAQERERDYREHIARLTTMLDQAHQQNQRLLDMPRSASLPPQSPPEASGATQTREPRREGDSHAASHSASQPRRRGIFGGRCADVSWPCSRRILTA